MHNPFKTLRALAPSSALGLLRASATIILTVILLASNALPQSESESLGMSSNELARRVITNELKIQAGNADHWMYRLEKEESGMKQVQEILETNNGSLSRLLSIGGHPLDAKQQQREDQRMQRLVSHPDEQRKLQQSEFALVEGELKETKSRNNPLPLAESVLQVLRLWRENTAYRSDEDWIFASPHYHGKTPYTYQILFRRHIRPVIERISGIKSSKEAPIGWHTLRRSLATLLISNGENVKVAQSQLRHTTPKITLEL